MLQLSVAGLAIWTMSTWKQPRRAAPLTSGLATIAPYLLAMTIGFLASDLLSDILHLPQHAYPWAQVQPGAALVLSAINRALPGLAEELALLGTVTVGLRRANYSWTTVCIVAVVLRVPFHLYYGWGALALAVWPLVGVYLYRRSGAIWGLVVAHMLWNLTAYVTVAAAVPVVLLRPWIACVGTVLVLILIPLRRRGGASPNRRSLN